MSTTLNTVLKRQASKDKPRRRPLWLGPIAEGWNGGITQSMIGDFLVCRERFRLKYLEGWNLADKFNHRLGYGDLWHVCEEVFALDGHGTINTSDHAPWITALRKRARDYCVQYPLQKPEIDRWYQVCKLQFPLYVKYWQSHKDVTKRTPVLSEVSFDIPIELPSGRVVRLRGKWDSVDVVTTNRKKGLWLQENKTKGDIDEEKIKKQLTFDLQTMTYLTALDEATPELVPELEEFQRVPLRGVRYNVIRRPLAGGKGTIVQGKGTEGSPCNLKACKESIEKTGRAVKDCRKCAGTGRLNAKPPESDEDYYQRLSEKISELQASEEFFFKRWSCEVSADEIDAFKTMTLHPILEQVCDWYDEQSALMSQGDNPFANTDSHLHFRFPYGVYNPMTEGAVSDLDKLLQGEGTIGLQRVDRLFPEL